MDKLSLLVVMGVPSLGVLASLWMLARTRRMLRIACARIATLESQLETLASEIGGLSAIDPVLREEHMRLELRLAALQDRQEYLELRGPGTPQYDHALRMVRHGVAPDQLVSSCGLNRGEAELMIRLHGEARSLEGSRPDTV